jgi:putative DNA primase/helicase
MDAKGIPIFCEGLATGLSIQAVMRANKMRYTIYVCFSASNLKEVSRSIREGIVVADNDPSGVGEGVAKETGKPYWLSDTVGEDFNDYHMRVGVFKASQSLKKTLLSYPSKTSPLSA